MSKALPAARRYTIGGSIFEAGSLPPALYLVATPIGNLRDVTIRALETLASADLIYCEDTRISSKLLARYGIANSLKPYHDHNAAKVRPVILESLGRGASIALISDAGTPLISDPGYKLAVEAIAQGSRVEMVPGPSAPIMALALSGLPVDRFLFAGFLPAKQGERLRVLEELKSVPAALIFFEAPGRVAATMEAIKLTLGDRRVALARELTKLHEEILRGRPDEIIAAIRARGSVKGEITIVVDRPSAVKSIDCNAVETALFTALQNHSPAKAASLIAKKLGLPKKQLYALALSRKDKSESGQGNE
jgi:16S rRNA (cytidine1402-2'-O)-methyltransferase